MEETRGESPGIGVPVKPAGYVEAENPLSEANASPDAGFEIVEGDVVESVNKTGVFGKVAHPTGVDKKDQVKEVKTGQGQPTEGIAPEQVVDVEQDHPVARKFVDVVAPQGADAPQVIEKLLKYVAARCQPGLCDKGLIAPDDFLMAHGRQVKSVVGKFAKAAFVGGLKVRRVS